VCSAVASTTLSALQQERLVALANVVVRLFEPRGLLVEAVAPLA
jgi:hypothetical protein